MFGISVGQGSRNRLSPPRTGQVSTQPETRGGIAFVVIGAMLAEGLTVFVVDFCVPKSFRRFAAAQNLVSGDSCRWCFEKPTWMATVAMGAVHARLG
mmetsp:Transcript_47006/g.124496  ORF Transcript_47006/g.124496 Transcript_47006/m.124496 type:complete len:97 (+) Transcript_47006:1710-2000(+)